MFAFAYFINHLFISFSLLISFSSSFYFRISNLLDKFSFPFFYLITHLFISFLLIYLLAYSIFEYLPYLFIFTSYAINF